MLSGFDDEFFIRNRRSNPFTPRKMEQLSTIFQHRHGLANYHRTYGYGCYCLNLGDKPMTGMVSGVEPVDEMDRHCYKYTQCIKCLRMDHNSDCKPETTTYLVCYLVLFPKEYREKQNILGKGTKAKLLFNSVISLKLILQTSFFDQLMIPTSLSKHLKNSSGQS